MGTKQRLEIGADLLTAIERNRARTADAGLGAGIERSIVNRELRELERDILADPGALESRIVKVRPRRRAS